MPTLLLTTFINAPIERVFNLARSIDFHKISTDGSKEEAIDGKTSGLINQGEFVTWRATHLGVRQLLSSKIVAMEYPYYFRDEMIQGIFKKLEHDHRFDFQNGITGMHDVFYYESPAGIFGKLADTIFLKDYLLNVLEKRNQLLKKYAESDLYKTIECVG